MSTWRCSFFVYLLWSQYFSDANMITITRRDFAKMNCELQYPFRPGWHCKCFAHCFWWHPRVLLTVSNSEQHVSIFGQKFPHFKYLCKGLAHCFWWHPRILLTVSNSEQYISLYGKCSNNFKNISSDGLIFFLFNSIFCVFVAIYT